MRIDYLSSDILLFRGDSQASLATAFIDGERVLLVDALASPYDAIDMRDYLETSVHKRVEKIVLTHAEGAHAAGVALFPHAEVASGPGQPHSLQWGRHQLELFQVPGAASISIDVADADLLLAPDSIVGNVAVLGQLSPAQADQALARLQERQRAWVVPRQAGALHGKALGNARDYLARLGEEVGELRATLAPQEAACAIAGIAVDDLLAPGEFATPLERHWHADNLKQVAARQLFPAVRHAARPTLRSRGQACCETVMSVLNRMLGGLTERGV